MIVEKLLRVALFGSSWVLYLLLALSVFSLGVIVERWAYFRRRKGGGDALFRRVSDALREGKLAVAERALAEDRSVEAAVVREALRWREGGPEAVSDAVEGELGRARVELERGINALGTLGNNAPFIGLFGTVLGVVEAFKHLGDGAGRSGGGGMSNVMAGIAEALVATAVGIFVALPAVVAYNTAQKRIGDVENAAHALGKLLTAFLKADGRRVAEESAAGAPATSASANGSATKERAGRNGRVALAAD